MAPGAAPRMALRMSFNRGCTPLGHLLMYSSTPPDSILLFALRFIAPLSGQVRQLVADFTALRDGSVASTAPRRSGTNPGVMPGEYRDPSGRRRWGPEACLPDHRQRGRGRLGRRGGERVAPAPRADAQLEACGRSDVIDDVV